MSEKDREFILCPVCFKQMRLITIQHLRKHGFQMAKEFKAAFGMESLACLDYREIHRRGLATRNPTKGVGHSTESIEKIRRARKGKGIGVCGKYERTPEIRARISASLMARKNKGFGQGRWIETDKARACRWGIVYVLSSWEERVVQVLELHPYIVSFVVEPFTISYEFEGQDRLYRPDFLIETVVGISEVWEIKPAALLNDLRNKAKIDALNGWSLGTEFNTRVVTLPDIEEMESQVSWRSGFRVIPMWKRTGGYHIEERIDV